MLLFPVGGIKSEKVHNVSFLILNDKMEKIFRETIQGTRETMETNAGFITIAGSNQNGKESWEVRAGNVRAGWYKYDK